MPGEAITKETLFARLAEGLVARVTVVTPNRRLAQVLRTEFSALQAGKGLQVWEDADILPLGAFLERLYEDALYSGSGGRVPMLLGEAQELALWQAAIARSHPELPGRERTAAQCREAWRLAHAWRIDGAIGKIPGSEDHEAFAAWARAYREGAAGCTDRARLADVVAGLLPETALRKPKRLAAYAFDLLPPQTREFFEACGHVGIELCRSGPKQTASRPTRSSFRSPREELEAAARWARGRLAAGAKRIGIVVPELQERRTEVVRVFSRVMHPGFGLPGERAKPMPFNVSLGEPLAAYPLVRAALAILDLAFGEISFEAASRLIRSPFLGGAESETARRARLDAELRTMLPARLTLAKLIGAVEGGSALRSVLERIFSLAKRPSAESLSPHDWAQRFTAVLDAAGFPGERSLSSQEFQVREKLFEALRELALLERVTGKVPLAEARAALGRRCEQTLFQPESPEAPVQVLGILESAGIEFEHLWVSGMTEEAWPLAARHNPFLPLALQKKAGIPEASAETSLALDRTITEAWMRAAPEVVFSRAEKDGDRDLLPSPLVAQLPLAAVEIPEHRSYRDLVFAAGRTESFADETAPAFAQQRVRGGTRVMADQAACPFRSFARHRLGAEVLESPAEGPDERARGLLLHELMKHLWNALQGSAGLRADPAPAIEKAAAAAVKEAGLEGRFAALERARLAKLAAEWLEVERQRGEFEVLAAEKPVSLEAGGLSFSGRIDREDRLADGSRALIDYKTGRPSPADWLGERPEEPQLPLYAVNASEDVCAVAFAKLKTGEMRFMGFSRSDEALPEVKAAQSWQGLLDAWKHELDRLGRGFAAGDARVDPKKGLASCRYCGLQPLCRVYERLSALGAEEQE